LAGYFLIIDGILKIFILFIFQKIVELSAILLITSATVAMIISSIINLKIIINKGIFFGGKEELINIREVLKFSYPISISAILNWIQLQGYKLVLVPLGATEAVGIFSTVSNIGAACMASFGSIYSQMKTPELYKSRGKSIVNYLQGIIVYVMLVSFSGWFFSEIIINLLTNKELAIYANLIVFGILIEGGNLILGSMGIAHSLNRSTNILMSVGIIGFLSCIGGFYIFYKWINITTIGYPILFSQIVTVLFMWISVRKSGWMQERVQ